MDDKSTLNIIEEENKDYSEEIEEINKIQINASAYAQLLNIEYYFCLSWKGKGFEVRLRFLKTDFHHLEGIGQLKDLDIHAESGNVTFDKSLNGDICEKDLSKSCRFKVERVQNKIDYLHMLEQAIDNNEWVFRYNGDNDKRSEIQAELFLFTDVDGNDIYVYIDRRNNRESDYYCRSFVANPDYDRKLNQKKLTTLWKEKIDLTTGKSEVLYRYKNFIPAELVTQK